MDDLVGVTRPYWSPVTTASGPQPSTDFELGDAGITENLHLISLLRRTDLKGFLILHATNTPMKGAGLWNPADRVPETDDVDDALTAYFGINSSPKDPGYFYGHNHVFERAQFVPLIQKFQKSMASGDGCVAQMELTTVENDYWGIDGVGKSSSRGFIQRAEHSILRPHCRRRCKGCLFLLDPVPKSLRLCQAPTLPFRDSQRIQRRCCN